MHNVVYPAEGKRRLVARGEPALPQQRTVPTGFTQSAGYHGEGTQGSAVVVQFGANDHQAVRTPDGWRSRRLVEHGQWFLNPPGEAGAD